jgi:hypothetical protein
MKRQTEEGLVAKQLVAIAGLERGRVILLSDTDLVQLGCGQNLPVETRFRESGVARLHCEVQVVGDRVILTDSCTAGGTFLNGKRVTQMDLKPGDLIRIGNAQLRFLCDDATGPAEAAPAALLPADSLSLLPGRTFVHFKVELLVGTGYWGRVFRARDTRSDKTVALKVLRREFAESPEMIDRFAQALKAVMPLRHSNLLTHYGAGRAGPYCWIATEYVEGKSLTQVIRRIATTGPIDWHKAHRVALEVSQALQVAHQQCVVHGHITPQNILVCDSDQLTKLTDLMLARTLAVVPLAGLGPRPDDTPYLAPERASGAGSVDERSDIYGLGAVVYAMLTGHPPFQADPSEETLEEDYQAEPVKPSKYRRKLPSRFENLVLKMLRRRPEYRFQTAAELVADLEEVSKGSRSTT